MTAYRLVAPGGRGLKGIEMEGGVTANRYKVSFWGDENVLELHPWLHNCEYIKTRVTLFKWVNSSSVKLQPPPFLHRAQTTSPPDLNCHQKAEHTPPLQSEAFENTTACVKMRLHLCVPQRMPRHTRANEPRAQERGHGCKRGMGGYQHTQAGGEMVSRTPTNTDNPMMPHTPQTQPSDPRDTSRVGPLSPPS